MHTVKLRDLDPSDIVAVDAIYRKHHQESFGIPDRDGALDIIAEVDGKVVAYGMLKCLYEALFVLDLDISLRERGEILGKLIELVKNAAREHRIKQIHVFVKHSEFAEILKNHYGFSRVNDIPLVLNL